MPNNRQKGKRIEREFVKLLKPILPNLRRNANEQSQRGGVDIIDDDHPYLDFEVKGGKSYVSKMIRAIIDQVEREGAKGNLKIACVKPDREDPYYILTHDTLIEVLGTYLKHLPPERQDKRG